MKLQHCKVTLQACKHVTTVAEACTPSSTSEVGKHCPRRVQCTGVRTSGRPNDYVYNPHRLQSALDAESDMTPVDDYACYDPQCCWLHLAKLHAAASMCMSVCVAAAADTCSNSALTCGLLITLSFGEGLYLPPECRLSSFKSFCR